MIWKKFSKNQNLLESHS